MRKTSTDLCAWLQASWLVLALLLSPPLAAQRDLLLATTTSVRDSGLLDELLPLFQDASGIHVRPIAVGSGAALRMGAEGNADVLLTHAPRAEKELLAAGALVSRVPFMENHFVLAGPPEDPADAATAGGVLEALRRIWAQRPPYVSRGDDSGTHRKELELLAAAGLGGADWPGFADTGSGMGLSLQVAGDRRAYILSDIGTFLAFEERTGLVVLSRAEPLLRNEYSVLRVEPGRFEGINGDAAAAFEAFLLEPATQKLIDDYGRERFGRALFHGLHPGGSGGR